MKDIIPFEATIKVGDTILQARKVQHAWEITMIDQVDNRQETKGGFTEGQATQITADFCQPTAPGSAFVAVFPFWC